MSRRAPHVAAIRKERQMTDNTLMTTRETADLARVSIRTLERLAERGEGPARIRLTQRRIAYRRDDVMRWIESRVAASTKRSATA